MGISENMITNTGDEEKQAFEARMKKKREKEKARHALPTSDRQKDNESIFNSLLTVNVDLPQKSASRKSPGGTMLKSPNLKSPNKGGTPTVSPGSHRSPMISPGGKPTYLLAHMHDKAASREAEKIHRAQEREMQKKVADKLSKD